MELSDLADLFDRGAARRHHPRRRRTQHRAIQRHPTGKGAGGRDRHRPVRAAQPRHDADRRRPPPACPTRNGWPHCRAKRCLQRATMASRRDRFRSARWKRLPRCGYRRCSPNFIGAFRPCGSSLRTATTADLVAAVLDGTLDGAFVAGPIEHAELSSTVAFKEELVLVTARRWTSLAALRAGTPESGPTALVFRTGCTYRQRLEQVFTEFGWPSASRFELGTLDGMIGCVAADMGVTLLPRAVVGARPSHQEISIHTLRRVTIARSRRSSSSAAARINTVRCKVLSPAWTNAKRLIAA